MSRTRELFNRAPSLATRCRGSTEEMGLRRRRKSRSTWTMLIGWCASGRRPGQFEDFSGRNRRPSAKFHAYAYATVSLTRSLGSGVRYSMKNYCGGLTMTVGVFHGQQHFPLRSIFLFRDAESCLHVFDKQWQSPPKQTRPVSRRSMLDQKTCRRRIAACPSRLYVRLSRRPPKNIAAFRTSGCARDGLVRIRRSDTGSKTTWRISGEL